MEIPALALAFGKSFLLALAGVLPILNPPASAPVFVNLTRELDPARRRALATRIGRNVVLDFFGVSIPIVRVAGGLIVAFTAWNMLYAPHAANADNADNAEMARKLVDDDHVRIQAFYPMTFPLTCGPGSISAAITVGAALHSRQWPVTAAQFAGGLAAVVVIGVLVVLN